MPELPENTHIGRVHLRVADLDRSLGFYEERLGFHVLDRNSGVAMLSAGKNRPELLRLTEHSRAKPRPRRTTGLFHVAIRLPNRAALGRELIRMVEYQVELGGFSDHGVSEALYLADPDENGIEIYADRPREQWQYDGEQVAMFTKQLDVNELMAIARETYDPNSEIDPDTDIGHIHLQVSDLKKAEEFYHEQLGFNVTQRSYPGALFFAAGDYHHHIGTNTWAGRGAPPPPPDAAGLIAYSITIPSTDKTGQHVVHDPDGNTIELEFVKEAVRPDVATIRNG